MMEKVFPRTEPQFIAFQHMGNEGSRYSCSLNDIHSATNLVEIWRFFCNFVETGCFIVSILKGRGFGDVEVVKKE